MSNGALTLHRSTAQAAPQPGLQQQRSASMAKTSAATTAVAIASTIVDGVVQPLVYRRSQPSPIDGGQLQQQTLQQQAQQQQRNALQVAQPQLQAHNWAQQAAAADTARLKAENKRLQANLGAENLSDWKREEGW